MIKQEIISQTYLICMYIYILVYVYIYISDYVGNISSIPTSYSMCGVCWRKPNLDFPKGGNPWQGDTRSSQ